MAILVKICGITSAEAADAAVRAGADFAGLMFHPNSPRNLAIPQAKALAARMRGRVRLVAVMRDASDDELGAVIDHVSPDLVQLHGTATPERIAAIRGKFGVGIIRAIGIADAADLAGAAVYDDCADMLMFDAKPPAGADREGGHGAAFDWQILRGRKFARPWLLAGGLTPDNVARAIAVSGAPGVDVSSGVETAPGVKSAERIEAFVRAARTASIGAAA